MVEALQPYAEWVAVGIEVIGIVVIAAFAVQALITSAVRLVKREAPEKVYRFIRHRLGSGILLGLEFLVAADIVHTVAVELTLESVGLLGLVVLIRTFLSFTLEVEINGRWPWQRGRGGGVHESSEGSDQTSG